ncbi:putative Ig domain-containing protein [Actinoplanes sp. NPDC049802]|uniref:putative Ig domain-containing protein n=1 Tax=Actinoplanes sp. NPDC049802 TaxID=3154742 RepID=UPI0033D26B31
MGSEQQREKDDNGFSVVEMLVALVVLSITMLAGAPFFVQSLTIVNKQRNMQAAIQLANTAMEHVRGLRGSSLLTGRSLKATQAQFDAAPASVKPYLTQMKVAGDPVIQDPTSTVGATAPISTAAQKVTVDGITFTQNIYVGNCEVYLTGTSTECVYPKAATIDTTKVLQFFRVVVLVTWPHASCRTTDGRCAYISTTLVSRASEPTFDFNRPSPQVLENNPTWYVGDTDVSYQMAARGGQLPNTWTVSSLPPGLTMNSAGLISGIPTTAVVLNATATVTDKYNRNNSAAVKFTVVRPPTVSMPANTTSQVGKTVALKATAANGVPAYKSYEVENLPLGLTFDTATGAIGGAPATPGTYLVTVTVTDANNRTGTGTYTHVVLPSLVLGALADQNLTLTSQLDVTATASGGDGVYTFSAVGLPPGPAIRVRDGVVSGRSTATGRFQPTITVTDGTGATASRQFVIIVDGSGTLKFTAPSLTAPDQSTKLLNAASLSLVTNASQLIPVPTVTMTVTGLPPGLTFNASTRVISGTPSAAGIYHVTATATSQTPPATSILNFTWTVTA